MAQQVAELAVRLVGDNAHVQRMFNQTRQQGAGMSSSIVASSRAMAVGLAGAAAAGTLVLGVTNQVTTATAEMGRELLALAVTSNLSLQGIQEIGYATETVGVSTEQAGDILKDFQDKLGDFRSTGGGGFADFFEQVGDKVGITADELARLSGPEALIAVKKAMDDANVSADRQVFYLESLASDASRLTPLLANNGREFRNLVQHHRDMDVALTNSQLDKFKDYDQDLKDLGLIWDSLTREVVFPFVGALADGAKWMTALFGANRTAEIASLETKITTLVDKLDNFTGGKRAKNTLTKQLSSARIELKALLKEQEEAENNGAFGLGLGGNGSGFIPPSTSSDAAAKRLASQQTAGAAMLAQLDMQYATEQERLRLNLEQQTKQIDSFVLSEAVIREQGFVNLTDLQTAYLEKAQGSYVDHSVALAQEQARQTAEIGNQDQVAYTAGIARLNQHLEEKLISQQEYHEKAAALEASYQQTDKQKTQQSFEALKTSLMTERELIFNEWETRKGLLLKASYHQLASDEEINNLMLRSNRDFGEKLNKQMVAQKQEQLATSGELFGNLAGMAATFAGEQTGIYKALFVASKAFHIAESIMAIQSGIAQAAAQPFPLNLAAMGSVVAATAGIVSTIQGTELTGMAHDGIDSVPQEGTWLLQKGERVINAEQNEKITNALTGNGGGGFSGNVIIYNNGNAQETTNASVNSNGDLEIFLQQADAYVAQGIYSGTGQTARASQAVYGNNRARTSRR